MDYSILRSKQLQLMKFEQKTNVMKIRLIHIPYNCDLHHYPNQNLFARNGYKKIHFDKIQGDQIESFDDASQVFNSIGQKVEQVFFIENSILVNCLDHVRIFKVDNLSEFKIFQCELPQHIFLCKQIHRNSIIISLFYYVRIKLTIYDLRNFKKSRSIMCKRKIEFVKQNGFIIQAVANKCLYFYNTRMKKLIRRFDGFEEKQPNFDSNFLIIPFYELFGRKWIQTYLNIYDISSMKVKGVIETQSQSEQSYESSLFIQRLNVIAIMYARKLDLFEMNSLKYLGSEQIQHYGRQQQLQIMSYDEENGFIVFIKDLLH